MAGGTAIYDIHPTLNLVESLVSYSDKILNKIRV